MQSLELNLLRFVVRTEQAKKPGFALSLTSRLMQSSFSSSSSCYACWERKGLVRVAFPAWRCVSLVDAGSTRPHGQGQHLSSPWLWQHPPVSEVCSLALCQPREVRSRAETLNEQTRLLFDTGSSRTGINGPIRSKLRIDGSSFYYQLRYVPAATLSKSLSSVMSPCVKLN